jgi:hypothetical protein
MSGEPETASREMPKYKCHKEVHALKIAEVSTGSGTVLLRPADESYAVIELPIAWAEKHRPKIGGYYVVYEDGYESYSPGEAFERGYTLRGRK